MNLWQVLTEKMAKLIGLAYYESCAHQISAKGGSAKKQWQIILSSIRKSAAFETRPLWFAGEIWSRRSWAVFRHAVSNLFRSAGVKHRC